MNKSKFGAFRARGVKLAVAASSALASGLSMAQTSAIDTAITAAQESGKTSVQLTTTGMIQIVAVVVAIGLIIALLRKI